MIPVQAQFFLTWMNRDRDRLQKYWANIFFILEPSLFLIFSYEASHIISALLPCNDEEIHFNVSQHDFCVPQLSKRLSRRVPASNIWVDRQQNWSSFLTTFFLQDSYWKWTTKIFVKKTNNSVWDRKNRCTYIDRYTILIITVDNTSMNPRCFVTLK